MVTGRKDVMKCDVPKCRDARDHMPAALGAHKYFTHGIIGRRHARSEKRDDKLNPGDRELLRKRIIWEIENVAASTGKSISAVRNALTEVVASGLEQDRAFRLRPVAVGDCYTGTTGGRFLNGRVE
jgi:hypothetical protein